MKIGVLGTGMIAKEFLQVAPTVRGITLAALCSTPRSAALGQALCAQYHIPHAFTDTAALLADATVDTVYLGIPNALHYETAKKALLAGKNVLCEKPMAPRAAEVAELMELAKAQGRFLLEAVTTRYLPNVLKMRTLLPALGEVKLAVLNFSQYSSRYDAFKRGVIAPVFDPKQAGGALNDLNVYNINLLVALFGAPQTVHYQANITGGIDTSGILTLGYGHFQAACIAAKDCGAPLASTIQGDAGNLHFSVTPNSLEAFALQKNGEEEQRFALNGPHHRMYHELVEFERIIAENDLAAAAKSQTDSLIAAKVLTEARAQAGIIFPGD